MRLDVFLKEKNFCKSRQNGIELIKNGQIKVNNVITKKTSFNVFDSDIIEIIGNINPYVSRGGLKLEKALKEFDIKLDQNACLDIGASTGGFTDCMLQNGAKIVYAVDVGTSQLDEKIKSNPKVINLEKTNIKDLSKENFPYDIDFVSCDVSFISVYYVAKALKNILNKNTKCVILIKPQFEAGRENLNKKGIVNKKEVHLEVLLKVKEYFSSFGFVLEKIDFSPVCGGDGNIEYLGLFVFEGEKKEIISFNNIVDKAFSFLKEGKK